MSVPSDALWDRICDRIDKYIEMGGDENCCLVVNAATWKKLAAHAQMDLTSVGPMNSLSVRGKMVFFDDDAQDGDVYIMSCETFAEQVRAKARRISGYTFE